MSANEDDAAIVLSPAGSTTELQWWRPIVETVGAVFVIAGILYILDTWNKSFETNAILIAIFPVLFWLFASGRLASFKAFGVEMKSAILASIERDDLSRPGSGNIKHNRIRARRSR